MILTEGRASGDVMAYQVGETELADRDIGPEYTEPWLELRLLGPFDARLRGNPLPPPRSQKERWLLAILALRPGRPVEREWLAGKLWPDSPSSKAAYNLRRALSDLRTALGDDERAIETPTAHTVRLRPDGVLVDAALFDEAIQKRNDLEALERAVDLYRGELLEGVENEWINTERGQRQGQYHNAVERLAHLAFFGRDYGRALVYLTRVLADDPLSESACRMLMQTHAARRDFSAAISAYRDLRARLRSERNMEPSADLTDIYRRILDESVKYTRGEEPPELPPEEILMDWSPTGALPPGSPLYLERATDGQFRDALRSRHSIVLVKAPRQFGKTSLLARGLDQVREAGSRVAVTDLQRLNAAQLASSEALLRALIAYLSDELNLDPEVCARFTWSEDSGPNDNFERFLRRCVLRADEAPVVWALDEADRLFEYPYCSEVFGLMRSWHNDRALDPDGPWGRLTLAISYATEAHLFITDMNQSPFNVGTRLTLESFTPDQVADLNGRYRAPLESAADRERFVALVEGHPYLTQVGLWALRSRTTTLDDLEDPVHRLSKGPYEDHLRRLLHVLDQNPRLRAALLPVVRDRDTRELTLDDFFRLRAVGVLVGDAPPGARVRCALYEKFLRAYLRDDQAGNTR